MEVKTVEDAEAVLQLRRVQAIQKVKRAMSRLYYFPAMVFACTLVLSITMQLFDYQISAYGVLVFLGGCISSVGHACMKQIEYSIQLSELQAQG